MDDENPKLAVGSIANNVCWREFIILPGTCSISLWKLKPLKSQVRQIGKKNSFAIDVCVCVCAFRFELVNRHVQCTTLYAKCVHIIYYYVLCTYYTYFIIHMFLCSLGKFTSTVCVLMNFIHDILTQFGIQIYTSDDVHEWQCIIIGTSGGTKD